MASTTTPLDVARPTRATRSDPTYEPGTGSHTERNRRDGARNRGKTCNVVPRLIPRAPAGILEFVRREQVGTVSPDSALPHGCLADAPECRLHRQIVGRHDIGVGVGAAMGADRAGEEIDEDAEPLRLGAMPVDVR